MKNNTNGCEQKLPRVWSQKLERVTGAVVEEFGYKDESEIWERSRVPLRCWSRWIVWAFMRDMGMTYAQIGDYCGMDHGSVMHGENRLRDGLRKNPDMRSIYNAVARKSSHWSK
tara:strand:- start:270 stop:611 length:342 start_codon:yes stop_codon:yes gene_type:complete